MWSKFLRIHKCERIEVERRNKKFPTPESPDCLDACVEGNEYHTRKYLTHTHTRKDARFDREVAKSIRARKEEGRNRETKGLVAREFPNVGMNERARGGDDGPFVRVERSRSIVGRSGFWFSSASMPGQHNELSHVARWMRTSMRPMRTLVHVCTRRPRAHPDRTDSYVWARVCRIRTSERV